MTCTSCSGTVENALRSMAGVVTAVVNLSTNTADVTYRHPATTTSMINEVESVGFGAELLSESVQENHTQQALQVVVFGIDGMTCSSCSGTVENAIKSVTGVTSSSVVVSLSTNTATCMLDASVTSAKAIVAEIEAIGFGAEILECTTNAPDRETLASGHGSLPRTASVKMSDDVGVIKTVLLILDVPETETARRRTRSRAGTTESTHGLVDEEMGQSVACVGEPSLEQLRERLVSTTGVQAAELRSEEGQIKITYDDFLTGPRDFVATGNASGYSCTVSSMGGFMMANRLMKSQAAETKRLLSQLLLATALTVPIICITMVLPAIPAAKRALMTEIFPGLAVNGALLLLFSFPVQFYVGHQFHEKAWKTLKARALGMDFLVSTGTLAAYLYSTFGLLRGIAEGEPDMHDVEYFETSAVLITAVLLGKYLEVYARGKTAAAIHKLSKLKAHTARLVRSGTGAIAAAGVTRSAPASPTSPSAPLLREDSSSTAADEDEVIDASLLHRRDVVRLVAGESVPADGVLLPGGHIGVDEAMMTVSRRSLPHTAPILSVCAFGHSWLQAVRFLDMVLIFSNCTVVMRRGRAQWWRRPTKTLFSAGPS
jgi:Cu+-exporting ATPase